MSVPLSPTVVYMELVHRELSCQLMSMGDHCCKHLVFRKLVHFKWIAWHQFQQLHSGLVSPNNGLP